ncbi:hypothetical protein PSRA_1760 [Pseudoscardovia radai]|uniref:Uncharacterized protein n=1 Tax=Pseudoscardovia radai TaxID=987066 RepID=A0A261EPM9_9BIFI|nr:hypothetical protein [Pseudoscardovia radai]OZG48809.1 hypothetical protein PSRA_1760 [Pseudoscardovia radai]
MESLSSLRGSVYRFGRLLVRCIMASIACVAVCFGAATPAMADDVDKEIYGDSGNAADISPSPSQSYPDAGKTSVTEIPKLPCIMGDSPWLGLTPDGSRAVVLGRNGAVCVIDTSAMSVVATSQTGLDFTMTGEYGASISPDGATLYAYSQDAIVAVSLSDLRVTRLGAHCTSFLQSEDGTSITALCSAGGASRLDTIRADGTVTNSVPITSPVTLKGVEALAVSPDGSVWYLAMMKDLNDATTRYLASLDATTGSLAFMDTPASLFHGPWGYPSTSVGEYQNRTLHRMSSFLACFSSDQSGQAGENYVINATTGSMTRFAGDEGVAPCHASVMSGDGNIVAVGVSTSSGQSEADTQSGSAQSRYRTDFFDVSNPDSWTKTGSIDLSVVNAALSRDGTIIYQFGAMVDGVPIPLLVGTSTGAIVSSVLDENGTDMTRVELGNLGYDAVAQDGSALYVLSIADSTIPGTLIRIPLKDATRAVSQQAASQQAGTDASSTSSSAEQSGQSGDERVSDARGRTIAIVAVCVVAAVAAVIAVIVVVRRRGTTSHHD